MIICIHPTAIYTKWLHKVLVEIKLHTLEEWTELILGKALVENDLVGPTNLQEISGWAGIHPKEVPKFYPKDYKWENGMPGKHALRLIRDELVANGRQDLWDEITNNKNVMTSSATTLSEMVMDSFKDELVRKIASYPVKEQESIYKIMIGNLHQKTKDDKNG